MSEPEAADGRARRELGRTAPVVVSASPDVMLDDLIWWGWTLRAGRHNQSRATDRVRQGSAVGPSARRGTRRWRREPAPYDVAFQTATACA